MTDIHIRIEDHAGRITLSRPKALNALTYEMCLAIEQALITWRSDPRVALVIIDAEGDKAFCAGGDIADLYATGMAGNYAYGQKFWADEYRLNYRLKTYSKPVISFLQGFTMGGGVGVGCHGSHRIVGETSKIAMPEVGIGLVPDVGGSYILAHAPGSVGVFLGTTAYRMDAADAIFAGFADMFIPQSAWTNLIQELSETGDLSCIAPFKEELETSTLAMMQDEIDALFNINNLAELSDKASLNESKPHSFVTKSLATNSPLAMASALKLIRTQQANDTSFAQALAMEYRFTHRAMEHGDFLEGIRAAIIDKDKSPNWRQTPKTVSDTNIETMLAPLGNDELSLEED